MTQKRIMFMAALLSMLAGCVTIAERGLSVEPEETREAALSGGLNPDAYLPSKSSHSLTSWWTFFEDPVLIRLVESSSSLNPVARDLPRNNLSGSFEEEALRSYYRKPELRLVVEVVQSYLRYRYLQNQDLLLLEYVQQISRGASTPQIERERASLQNQHDKYSLQKKDLVAKISRITKLLPEYVEQIIRNHHALPKADVTPILVNPASIMMGANDIMVARVLLTRDIPSISEQQTQDLFGRDMFGTFFGVSDDIFTGPDALWKVSTGRAVERVALDTFEKIYGDDPAYIEFRERILSYLMDVEHALVSYAYMHEQHSVLKTMQDSAESEQEFFNARKATLRAEYEMAKMLVDLYKSLGVY
ncbi:MAG: hypothetical protein ACRBDL_05605 [Alphaproteobacteria bacterium]